MGFPCGSAGKESARNAGDLGSILELGRSPEEGKGYPLRYSGLENSMEWGRKAPDTNERLSLSFPRTSLVVQMVKNPPAVQETWVRSLGWKDPLEKGTDIHSGILAWRIPWTEEPGRLQSMELQRVGHD